MFELKKNVFWGFFLLLSFLNIYSFDFSHYKGRNFPPNTEIVLNYCNIGLVSNIDSKYATVIAEAIYYGDFVYLNSVALVDYDKQEKASFKTYSFIVIGLKGVDHREMIAKYEIAFSLFNEAKEFFLNQEKPKLDKVIDADYITRCETNISANDLLIKYIIDNFYYLDKLGEIYFKDNVIDIKLLDLNYLCKKIKEYKSRN